MLLFTLPFLSSDNGLLRNHVARCSCGSGKWLPAVARAVAATATVEAATDGSGEKLPARRIQ